MLAYKPLLRGLDQEGEGRQETMSNDNYWEKFCCKGGKKGGTTDWTKIWVNKGNFSVRPIKKHTCRLIKMIDKERKK